jgi:hypothetical protein
MGQLVCRYNMKKVQDCRGNGAAYTLPYYLANFAPWMPAGVMQRLTSGSRAGQRNAVTEEKVGVSKPMMGMLNDMANAVGGVLVRLSLGELHTHRASL